MALEDFEHCLGCPFEGLMVAAYAAPRSGHTTSPTCASTCCALRHLTEQKAIEYDRELSIAATGSSWGSNFFCTESGNEQHGDGSQSEGTPAMEHGDITDRLNDLEAMLFDCKLDAGNMAMLEAEVLAREFEDGPKEMTEKEVIDDSASVALRTASWEVQPQGKLERSEQRDVKFEDGSEEVIEKAAFEDIEEKTKKFEDGSKEMIEKAVFE
ncbi:unnamed protein product, partial [Prorocentrum cordatum]